MTSTAPTDSASRAKKGRPRSEGVEQAILKAAASLLAEQGLRALTIEDVAARAGVGKASIYRRWHSKGTLALEAYVTEFLAAQPPVDTGSLAGDMYASLCAWIHTVKETPTGRSLVGLVAEAQFDPDLAIAWRDDVVAKIRNQHRLTIERAIARGEIPKDSDVEVLMDLFYGPAYHRLLHGHLPLTEEFAHEVVAIVVAGAKAGCAVPSNVRDGSPPAPSVS
ncbi:MAG TPA: TetR/AcrR family transcriptional regulator [Acidimicrobiales bacterium]